MMKVVGGAKKPGDHVISRFSVLAVLIVLLAAVSVTAVVIILRSISYGDNFSAIKVLIDRRRNRNLSIEIPIRVTSSPSITYAPPGIKPIYSSLFARSGSIA